MNIQSYNPNFTANINSKKLNFKKDDFYVRIRGYGKNRSWANSVIETTDTAVNLIRRDTFIENILRFITAGVIRANQFTNDFRKKIHTGILREDREHWDSTSSWKGCELITNYSSIARYSTYSNRFDKMFSNNLKKPYDDIDLTVPIIKHDEKYLRHGDPKYIDGAFKHIFEIFDSFKKSFNHEDIKKEQLDSVNDHIAEIRWILAHATPWDRGSDAIANILMRAMYKSLGIKSYPLQKNISLDLEAFCTELTDYKKNFTKYFQNPPEIIE